MAPRGGRARRARPEGLAYVFYHRPRAGVPRATYERALTDFLAQLLERPTRGFEGGAVMRLPPVSWGGGPRRPLYVDWYVVSGFGDLDPIREVAYRPPWVDVHRRIARLFGDGGGALYATYDSPQPPQAPQVAAWFSGPEGRGASLLARWRNEGSPHGSLWRRQLALGSGLEYWYFGPTAPPVSIAPAAAVLFPEYLPVPRAARSGAR